MEKNKLIIGIVAVILIVSGVIAFYLIQPRELTIEGANIILDESTERTLDLTSFTTKGDADFQIKSGEIVLIEVAMKDVEFSAINVWDFAQQNSEMVVTYDVMMNLVAIADLIEASIPPEELDPDVFMGIDPIAMLKTIGEANIAVTMEMKLIDNDSYMKIREITGLRETITSAAGAFMADMIMGEIEPQIGVWFKVPATPETTEEGERVAEKINPLIDLVKTTLPDILFVKEVLPNTEVNDVAVYNFTTDIDLNKIRDLVISLIPVIGEMTGVDLSAEEIAEAKQDTEEDWPKVVTVIEAVEIDLRTYICQETKFKIKDVQTVNVSLYRIMAELKPMIIENMTPEELAVFNREFDRLKEAIGDISFVATARFIYTDHNAVAAITPPVEYQLLEDIIPAPEF